MDDSECLLEYRMGARRFWSIARTLSFCAILPAMLLIVVGDDLTRAIFLTVAIGAAIAVFAWSALMTGTFTDPEHLTVRTFGGATLIPWADVRTIKVVPLPSGKRGLISPEHLVLVHDELGRRYFLPQVHDRNLPDLEAVAADLTRIWVSRRYAT